MKVVWNGCDGYIAAEDAVREGYDFDGERLYHRSVSYAAFDAEKVTGEVDIDSPPPGIFYFTLGNDIYSSFDDGSSWDDDTSWDDHDR